MLSLHNSKIAIGSMLVVFLLSACGGDKGNLPVVTSYAKSGNTLLVSDSIITAFNGANDTVLVGDGASLLVHDDRLFIRDYKSSEKIIHVIDIPERQYVGSFGNFGDGPAEILQPGNMFILPDNRLALFDYGHWCIKSFDVDSALNNSDYAPQTIVRFSEHETKSGFPDRFVPVRNGWGIGRLIKPKDDGGYSQSLCSYDVFTGKIEPFGEQDNPQGFRSSVAVSEADNLVVEVSSTQDVIRMYDLAGNLNRVIHGPLYESRPSQELAFYSKAVIGDGKIFAVYSGENRLNDFYGKQIVVFTLDGEYLYTYQIDKSINDMSYSEDYERLYLSTDDDPQFCYLQLGSDSLPGGIKHGPAIVSEAVSSQPAEQLAESSALKDNELPTITLIDPDEKLRTVPVDKARLRPYRASDSSPLNYFALIFNQAQTPDTVRIDSISADIPCEIKFHHDFAIPPRVMTAITLIPEGEPTKDDVTLIIYYNGNRQQKLHVNLIKEKR